MMQVLPTRLSAIVRSRTLPWIRMAGYVLLALSAVMITGCGPDDDELTGISFAPDGEHVALIYQHRGLALADTKTSDLNIVAKNVARPVIAWPADVSNAVAYTGDNRGSLDIALAGFDGQTTSVARQPSREDYPLAPARGGLIYRSSDSGVAGLNWRSSTTRSASEIHLTTMDSDVLAPAISPDGKHLAWISIRNLRPQVFTMGLDPVTSVSTVFTTRNPFSLLVDQPVFSADSKNLYLISNASTPSLSEESTSPAVVLTTGKTVGDQLLAVRVEPPAHSTVVLQNPAVSAVAAGGDGNIYSLAGDQLIRLDSNNTTSAVGLPLVPKAPLVRDSSSSSSAVAVSFGSQVAATISSDGQALPLVFGVEDQVDLAEIYFRQSKPETSYKLYEELSSSLERTRNPALARLAYLANLRRLGRTREAVAGLESMAESETLPPEVPARYVWRLIGFSYLLDLDAPAKARTALARYASLRALSPEVEPLRPTETDSALNALHILETASTATQRLYRDAVQARLHSSPAVMMKLFEKLLSQNRANAAIQSEYLAALEGYDKEAYLVAPPGLPFTMTPTEKNSYYRKFVELASPSPVVEGVKLELFLSCIELRQFDQARSLLHDALTSSGISNRMEGVLEVFRNYIETPEMQPWIEPAVHEVFLHPDIRPLLKSLANDSDDGFYMALAAVKDALIHREPDLARREADAALAAWQKVKPDEQTPDLKGAFSRLLVFRGREAELRNLMAEAVNQYHQADDWMTANEADNFEFQQETRFRAGMLGWMNAEHPELLPQVVRAENATGLELVNPTWEPGPLKEGFEIWLKLYDRTTGTLHALAAVECGEIFNKLKLPWSARAAYRAALGDGIDNFVRAKALMELSGIDEYLDDPWNAARFCANLASLPGTDDSTRMWLSYEMARLHMSIGYKVGEAREALGIIVSQRPGSPLATQAEQLLVHTSR